jgi:single-strand DNA-binding protein
MTDINRVIEIGRLTRDAEVTYTPGGMAIAKFSIAVNRRVKSGDGWADEANYFDVQVFGKQAEGLKPYLLKGKMVGIDGYLKQDRWEKDGQKFSKVTINANDIELLSPKDKSGSSSDSYDNYNYE